MPRLTPLAGFIDKINEKTGEITSLIPSLMSLGVMIIALVIFIKSRSVIKALVFLFIGGIMLWMTGNLDWVKNNISDELSMAPAVASTHALPWPR